MKFLMIMLIALMLCLTDAIERAANQFPDGNNGGGASDQNVNYQ